MSRPARFLTHSLALAALLGGMALSTPILAQTTDQPVPSPTATLPSTDEAKAPDTPKGAGAMTKESKGRKGMRGMMSPERVEERIKELHDKLQITEEQTTAWNNVAETMRDNAKTAQALIQERHEKMGSRTALEDLESYQKIAAAHAEGLEKFIPVFQALYDSMSPEQKKNADMAFARYEGHDGKKATKAGKSSGKAK